MGNVLSGEKGGANDEENNVAISLAEAASTGARPVLDAFQKALHGGPAGGEEIGAVGPLIAGVLPMALSQEVAADGAKQAVEDWAQQLDLASRFASALKHVKTAAGSGAKAGLKEVERVVTHVDIEGNAMEIGLDIAAGAAAVGARVACFASAEANLTPTLNASRYTAILGPMFGGSFPTSAAVYNFIRESSDIVKLCGFGGIFTLGIFVISSGLAAASMGRTSRSTCYARFATLAAVTIVLTLFAFALCTLFSALAYKVVCGTICGVLIGVLIIAWLISGW